MLGEGRGRTGSYGHGKGSSGSGSSLRLGVPGQSPPMNLARLERVVDGESELEKVSEDGIDGPGSIEDRGRTRLGSSVQSSGGGKGTELFLSPSFWRRMARGTEPRE